MPKKDEITIGCKVDKEIADKLKERALGRGIGLNSLLKEIVKGYLDPVAGDDLLEISFLYDIDPQDLVCDIKEMLDNGVLIVKEGQLCSK